MIENRTPLQYPLMQRIGRILITDDWFQNSGANGTIQNYIINVNPDNDTRIIDSQSPVWVYDSCGGIKRENLWALQDSTSRWYIPRGTFVPCFLPDDSLDGHWEPFWAGVVVELSESGAPASQSGGPSQSQPVQSRSMISVSSSSSSSSQSESQSETCDINMLCAFMHELMNPPGQSGNDNPAGWMTFKDCDGNSHSYWGN